MIARRILAAFTAAAVVWWATEPRRAVPDLDTPTREFDLGEMAELGIRQARQIHGRTAPELAAEKRGEAWQWARIEAALACDADFRAIATRLENEFPQP